MVERVCLGKWTDGTYRLRVSRAGYNVMDTSLTVPQLVFDSQWGETLQIYQTGTFVIGAGVKNMASVVTWPDLGYVPYVQLYKVVSGRLYFSDWANPDGGGRLYTTRTGLVAHSNFTKGYTMQYAAYTLKVE